MKTTLFSMFGAALISFSFSVAATSLNCSGLSMNHGDGSADILRVTGSIVDAENLDQVKAFLEHKGRHHQLLLFPGVISSSKDSASRAHLLVGMTKFNLATDKTDIFELFLPGGFNSIRHETFTGFFRTAFDRGYPRLIRLVCSQE